MQTILLAPSTDFADRAVAVARTFAAAHRGAQPVVVVPTVTQIGTVREAWSRSLGEAAELLPRIVTPAHWLLDLPPQPGARGPMQRLLEVQQTLKAQRWLRDAYGAGAETGLWGLAQSLLAVCDELSAAWLPGNHATAADNGGELAARLEEALAAVYTQLQRRVLDAEAQLVLTFWRQLTTSGDPLPVQRRQIRALAAQNRAPVVWIAPVAPTPLEHEMLAQLAEHAPVCLLAADWQLQADPQPQAAALLAAWPELAPQPAQLDVAALAARSIETPPRPLEVVAARHFEDQAQAVATQLLDWLNGGANQLALIAQDRVAARRIRALLARAGIPVRDETGWKLSTTRAASAVVHGLDLVAADHDGPAARLLLDWLKHPFVLADEVGHAGRVALLERAVRRHQLTSGWIALTRAAAIADGGEATETDKTGPTAALVASLRQQARRWSRPAATLADWQQLLREWLDHFGVRQQLARDDAGRQLLHALAQLDAGAGSDKLSFAEYRALLSHLFETVGFREEVPPGSVRVTILPLASARMRHFDGVAVVGCDDAQMPARGDDPLFFSDRLRHELGLPDRAARDAQQARDLAELLLNNSNVVFYWQSLGDRGEPRRVAGWLQRLARSPGFVVAARTAQPVQFPLRATAVPAQPAPSAPSRVPQRITAYGYKRLRQCPYQFFALQMLALDPSDSFDRELEKREVGQWLHEILDAYHRALAALPTPPDRAARIAWLAALSAQKFETAIAADGLAIRFGRGWQRQLEAYVDWQLAAEAEGWQWCDGEVSAEQTLPLSDGGSVLLRGRLDRIDRHRDGTMMVRDYKLQSPKTLQAKLKDWSDDCQLPFYLLLKADDLPAQAGYLALDGGIGFYPLPDAPAARDQLRARLSDDFVRLRAGAPLPAIGDEQACRYCDARGLCRKGHWQS